MNIALVDDKSYGLAQIKNAFPSHILYDVEWFSSVPEFFLSKKRFDIVFLDYYLENDGITGDTIIFDVQQQAKTIIAFSSLSLGNEKMLSAGANYSVLKLLGEKNNALENLLLEISIEEENFFKEAS